MRKLLRRLSLPLPLGAHEEDEDGCRKPLWVPQGLPERMLGWMAWREQLPHAGAGGQGAAGTPVQARAQAG